MKALVFVAVLLGVAAPASAQMAVIDVAAIAKLVAAVDLAMKELETQTALHQKWVQVLTALPGMSRYNLRPMRVGRHDVESYQYGAPLLNGLNSGDARGELLATVTASVPLARVIMQRLPAGSQARRTIENQLAAIEISDSILQRGIHQVGATRAYTPALETAIENLTKDVVHPRTSYHYPTAILDKISGGEVIARQQDMVSNQLTSHVLEQLIDGAKDARDGEADTMNLRLADMYHGRDASRAMVAGTAHSIRTWRQP